MKLIITDLGERFFFGTIEDLSCMVELKRFNLQKKKVACNSQNQSRLPVGDGCILGVDVKKSAGQADLEEGYGIFKNEAQNLAPNYSPDSINTDGSLSFQYTIFPWHH